MVAGLNGAKQHAEALGGGLLLLAGAVVGTYFIAQSNLSTLAKVAASVGALAIPTLSLGYFGVSAIQKKIDDIRLHR